MASHAAEQENWDDDFEFSNSPRNSPIPAVAPIHTFTHTTTNTRQTTTNVRVPVNTYNSRSISDLHAQRSNSALPRQTAGSRQTHQQQQQQQHHHQYQQYHQQSQHQQQQHHDSLRPEAAIPAGQGHARRGRWSGNSEEDWDLDEPTINASQPPPPQAPTPLPQTHDHPQPRPSLDSHSHSHSPHLHSRDATGGNISPTMSAFSIPLSIDSSLHHGPGGHGHGHGHGHPPRSSSIGGSSTNFLLHTGRRSVLEMEKGRQQDRERRRLRKKSRPAAGGAVVPDEDAFDAYGCATVPRRYAPRDGDDSSVEQGSSGEDEMDGLEELEEEHPPAATTTTPAIIKAPSRLLNLALPTKSHDKLSAALASYTSTPSGSRPVHPSGSAQPARPAGVGSRSTTVVTISPPEKTATTSSTQHHGHSSQPPAKLVRKPSNSNVLTKSVPHSRPHPSSSKQSTGTPSTPSSSSRPIQHDSPAPSHPPLPSKHQEPTTHTQQQQNDDSHHHPQPYPTSPSSRPKDDCGASLAPSTSSHKEKRGPLLSRLGSLKRWGNNSASGSSGGLGSTLGLSRPGRDSVSPRVFSASRLPSFLGGSKVDLHAQSDKATGTSPEKGGDAASAKSPGRGRYSLLRKPSLVLSNASSSALAPVESRDEREEGSSRKGGEEEYGTSGRRGVNPFRRVSIQGMKRLVSDHHHHSQQEPHDGASTSSKQVSPAATPEKEKKVREEGGGHHRTISFTALARGKLGVLGASSEKGSRLKESASPAGRKSTDGRASPSGYRPNSQVPHTLGRTAALAKAPKPPLKQMSSSSVASVSTQSASLTHGSSMSMSESVGYGASGRIPIPSSVSTATSAGYQSSATSAAQSSTHKRTTSSATTTTMSSQSQSSPASTSPPFSLAGPRYPDNQRSLGPSHTREATVKPTIPLAAAVVKSYSAAEHTPKPRANVKPLPEMVPPSGSGSSVPIAAATVGRMEGKSAAAAAAAARDARNRSGSAGDTSRTTVSSGSGSQSRRGGELKIPARISMRQGSLKRELEAVKEFATSVEELKRLQSTHQSLVAALSPNPRRSSSRSSNQPVNPAVLQNINAQYGIWWECAELLVDLGGAAPPTVAGTPIQENIPTLPSSKSYDGSVGRSGTRPSFSSNNSSSGDLSSRQLELLKQMLSTPNPTSFNFADPSSASHTGSVKWPKGRSGAEFSGSGSDHVVSDLASSSAHGTKSSINSASSLHDQRPSSVSRAHAASTNYPYSQGTWNAKNRTGANPGSSRPNLSGVFTSPNPSNDRKPIRKPPLCASSTSRGTLADGSGSSANSGLATTDDVDEDASDWDLESSSDSAKGRRSTNLAGSSQYANKAPSSSTASSSADISQHSHSQTRLALTPETILPLLAYAREVKARLSDCLDELERAKTKSRSVAITNATSTTSQYPSRSSRAPEVGTSTLRRA